MLLRCLPADSALSRAANGAGSTIEEIGFAQLDLTALHIELTAEHIRTTMAAAGVKPGDLPPPLNLPRSRAQSTAEAPEPEPVPVVPPTDPEAITRQLMTSLRGEV